jgi:hypothetical protein
MSYYDNYYYREKHTPSAEEQVDRFLKKYESRAGLSSRELYYKRQPLRYTDWIANGSNIPFHQEIEKEPMVEMYIPQHRFQDLVERERMVDEINDQNRRYRQLLDQLDEDARIRNSNPTLKKAWDNYQLLLGLCRSK